LNKDGSAANRINGKPDFLVNGTLNWGIELVVNGDRIGSHMARFSPGGAYADLQVSEKDLNIDRYTKRATAFLTEDLCSLTLLYGHAGPLLIKLAS
jgi:hypothetical protein